MWEYNYTDELYHHGIKGQKWGVRRFQNEDGSLTPEGEKRYGYAKDYDSSVRERMIKADVDYRAKSKREQKDAAVRGKALQGKVQEISYNTDRTRERAYEEYRSKNRDKYDSEYKLDQAASKYAFTKGQKYAIDAIDKLGPTAYDDITAYNNAQAKKAVRSVVARLVASGVTVMALATLAGIKSQQ